MRRCMLRRMNRASVKWRVPHAQPACASTASDIISGVSFTVSAVSVLVLLQVLTPSALGCNTFQMHPRSMSLARTRSHIRQIQLSRTLGRISPLLHGTKGVSRRNHIGPMTRAWCRGAHESYQARGSCRWSCPARQRCVRLYRRCAARRHAPRWTSCHSGAPPREFAPRGKMPTGKPRYREPRP